MKTNQIVSLLLVGLVALLASGCATVDLKNQKKNVQFEQVTPSSTEVELQAGPQGTVVSNKSGVVSQSQPTLAISQYTKTEKAGTTKYSDTSSDTSKHFSIDSPFKGMIPVTVVVSTGGGGYQYDDGYYQSSYGQRDNYRHSRNRPYPQNTGDGRIHRRQEQPRYRPAQYDRYGNFKPEGYYYSNGYSYPTHR